MPGGNRALSAAEAREFLRQAAELPTWTTAYAQKILAVDAKTTRDALKTLETTGYIEHPDKSKDTWRNTAAGNAAVGVSEARPVKRSTAEEKLNELLERVDHINDDPKYLFRISKVVVFGPYLAKMANIKDIDVAVELDPREKDAAKMEKLVNEHASKAEAAGKKFKNHAARRNWGRTEILDYLKGRSRTIALRELDDWVMNQPHNVVR